MHGDVSLAQAKREEERKKDTLINGFLELKCSENLYVVRTYVLRMCNRI